MIVKKRFLHFIWISICVLLGWQFAFGQLVSAASALELEYGGKKVSYTKARVGYTIKGKKVNLHNIPGIIISDTAMGDYKYICQTGLGAICNYDSETKELTIEKFDHKIVMKLNSKIAYVDGEKKTMRVALMKVKYVATGKTRILIPVRFVVENLGYTYTWSNKDAIGKISYSWVELYQDNDWEQYTGKKIKTFVNGKEISYGKMPGIYEEKVALVDAKRIFSDTMGMNCSYDSKSNHIVLGKDGMAIKFLVGEKKAIVNGEEIELGTAALRVKNRADGKYYLLVPAEFVALQCGYEIEWATKTKFYLYTDKLAKTAVTTGAAIAISLPEKIDLTKVKDADYYYKKKFMITIPGNFVEYYKKNGVGIYKDVVSKYTVDLNSSGNTKITFSTTKLQGYAIIKEKNRVFIRVGDPKEIYKNIVVLDCGHGGTDPGAQADGYDEKEITYAILYTYAKKYFNGDTSNVKAYWSRYEDSFVKLSDRAAYAKKVGADLFISLHMNSATNKKAEGTEVYYSKNNNGKCANGLTSKKMASEFQKGIVNAMGSSDRGVKAANYHVIKNNTVPAVLIELGFLSNEEERENLVDEDYQKEAAKCIYNVTEGIFSKYPTAR